MYRSQMTQELTGVPSKQEIRAFIKTVLFFYQVVNEEHLVDSLIQEGAKCINEKKLDDAPIRGSTGPREVERPLWPTDSVKSGINLRPKEELRER
jgi:hypothetical protein